MIEKVKSFKGGFVFANLQGEPTASIDNQNVPEEVVIPLKQGGGSEVKSIVKSGETVKAGQIIAIDETSLSSPVHATISGTVIDCERNITYGSKSSENENSVASVVIRADGQESFLSLNDIIPDADISSIEGVFDAIYFSGVSSLGTSGIPTPHNSSSINPDDVKNIIINGTTSEPFSLPSDLFSESSRLPIVIGINILHFLFPDAVLDIAVDSKKKEIMYGLFNLLTSSEDEIKNAPYADKKFLKTVLIHPLKSKYPQGDESLLVETILGDIPVPKGEFSAIDYGALILDIQDVIAVYEAVIKSKPLIGTVISLGGPGFKVNQGLRVRIGTSISDVLKDRLRSDMKLRIILNSVMGGEVVENLDLPVTSSIKSIIAIPENRDQEFLTFLRPGVNRGSFSNTFLSSVFRGFKRRIDTNLHGELRACIACNYCEYVCPVKILPFLISKYATHDMAEDTLRLNVLECIECGLCSYVCPSKIPIVDHIRQCKQELYTAMDEEEGGDEEDEGQLT